MTFHASPQLGPADTAPSSGGAIHLMGMSFESEDPKIADSGTVESATADAVIADSESVDISTDLEKALGGETAALERLLELLTPIIQVRVARTLLRRFPSLDGGRLRQEVEDLVQEVMVSLFAGDAAVLRSWDPSRGLSLENFVGLVAERQVATILQSRKKTWPAEWRDTEDLDRPSPERSPEQKAAARQTFERMLALLESELSEKGFDMFRLLFVEELSVPEVARRTGMGDDAIYAWRSRLRRKTRVLMKRIDSAPASAGRR